MKKKIVKYRLRWLDKRKTGQYWAPSAWETNSRKKAIEKAKEWSGEPTAQVWDYVNKCAI